MGLSVVEANKETHVHPTQNLSYVYGIDLLRFTAAAMVAFFHLTWLEVSTARIDWFGWIGVQIFFIISGFVIAQSAQNVGAVSFAISRFLRLYPAAFICAAINLATLLSRGNGWDSVPPLLVQFFRSLVLFPQGPFLATAYWTLPIEITFYALIGAVVCLRAFRHIESFALVLCAWSASYVALLGLQSLGLIDTAWLDFGYGWKNLTLLRHGIYFSGGIFLWLQSEHRLTRRGAIGLVAVLLAAPIEITCRTAELLKLSPVAMNLASVSWVPVLIWLLSMAFIAAAAHWRAEWRYLPRPVLAVVRLLGLTTYPFYLMHEVIGRAVRHVFLARGHSVLVSAIAGLLIAAAVALLVAYYAEPRLRKLLKARIESLRQRQNRLA
jgi:exopolysaccharide production protein ExoZ